MGFRAEEMIGTRSPLPETWLARPAAVFVIPGNSFNIPGGMRGEIQQKWGKFDAQEIAALKDKDDLVAGLQAKYQLDKPQAQRDVDAFAKGRQL
jgi:hypothetical protein